MVWFIIGHLFTTVLAWVRIGRLSEAEKDLEPLVLRQQLVILERHLDKPVHPSRIEKLTLAVVVAKLKTITNRPAAGLRDILRLFQPETVLKWHRELVRRKWTYRAAKVGGRPRTDQAIEALVVRFVRENADWSYGKIAGELGKLGYAVSEPTIASILERHGIPAAPQRQGSVSWRHLMTHYKDQILACHFFTVDTLFLHTVYVLFFIELHTRRVYLAGCTTHPDAAWVTQQVRQIAWQVEERQPAIHFLIHDRDTKFGAAFDTVFGSTRAHLIRTPFRAPNANAYAERWVRTVRHECLNKLFIRPMLRIGPKPICGACSLSTSTITTPRARTRDLISMYLFRIRHRPEPVSCAVVRCWAGLFTTTIARRKTTAVLDAALCPRGWLEFQFDF